MGWGYPASPGGEQEGEHWGEHPLGVRCSPCTAFTIYSRRSGASGACGPDNDRRLTTASSHARCGLSASGGALCRPPRPEDRPRCRQQQSRGVSDHHFGPLGLPSARPARWSLTPRWLCLSRSGSLWDACVRATSKACGSAFVNSGRRAAIVRLATRALKALRASSVSLRPRCAGLTALTARAATRSRAILDGQDGSA